MVFNNALEPIDPGELANQVFDETVRYRRYEGRGIFRRDTIATGCGEHSLATILHPRQRTRDNLINRTAENGNENVVRYRYIPGDVSPLKPRHTVKKGVIRHLRKAGIKHAYPRRRIREKAHQDAVE